MVCRKIPLFQQLPQPTKQGSAAGVSGSCSPRKGLAGKRFSNFITGPRPTPRGRWPRAAWAPLGSPGRLAQPPGACPSPLPEIYGRGDFLLAALPSARWPLALPRLAPAPACSTLSSPPSPGLLRYAVNVGWSGAGPQGSAVTGAGYEADAVCPRS